MSFLNSIVDQWTVPFYVSMQRSRKDPEDIRREFREVILNSLVDADELKRKTFYRSNYIHHFFGMYEYMIDNTPEFFSDRETAQSNSERIGWLYDENGVQYYVEPMSLKAYKIVDPTKQFKFIDLLRDDTCLIKIFRFMEIYLINNNVLNINGNFDMIRNRGEIRHFSEITESYGITYQYLYDDDISLHSRILSRTFKTDNTFLKYLMLLVPPYIVGVLLDTEFSIRHSYLENRQLLHRVINEDIVVSSNGLLEFSRYSVGGETNRRNKKSKKMKIKKNKSRSRKTKAS